MNRLDSINSTSPITLPNATEKTSIDTGGDFGALLQDAIQQVSQLQDEAGQDVEKVMTGQITDIHSAMIAVQKADVSFQMMMQVRNKLVSAYQEIMKMQV
jgi:flagellar hook-basal body complex protein FliE